MSEPAGLIDAARGTVVLVHAASAAAMAPATPAPRTLRRVWFSDRWSCRLGSEAVGNGAAGTRPNVRLGVSESGG
jgi:hypothetical protein